MSVLRASAPSSLARPAASQVLCCPPPAPPPRFRRAGALGHGLQRNRQEKINLRCASQRRNNQEDFADKIGRQVEEEVRRAIEKSAIGSKWDKERGSADFAADVADKVLCQLLFHQPSRGTFIVSLLVCCHRKGKCTCIDIGWHQDADRCPELYTVGRIVPRDCCSPMTHSRLNCAICRAGRAWRKESHGPARSGAIGWRCSAAWGWDADRPRDCSCESCNCRPIHWVRQQHGLWGDDGGLFCSIWCNGTGSFRGLGNPLGGALYCARHGLPGGSLLHQACHGAHCLGRPACSGHEGGRGGARVP
mmetsp:Transcript_4840/g.13472  ORF Transcript_4840/g.13472 Transcript_4840/m.13472 type:complete len:305 (+) Transcript_4840:177-1091(+)